tara:strand:+ start:7943 stop:8314 length:372 start_codon:yes stop_codon:yes gene_type:complete
MKYILGLIFIVFSLAFLASEKLTFEVGNELQLKRDNMVVLYHYKADAIEVNLTRDFIDYPSVIDVRDMYKIKKGEKIKLLESYRKGKIFKVELLKERAKRDHYFLEKESLRHYQLVDSKLTSS